MDVIQLPAVPIQTKLSDALGILDATRRSALVTEASAGLRLVTAGAVVADLAADDDQALSDVTHSVALPVAPGAPAWAAISAMRLVASPDLFTAGGGPTPLPTALGKRHQRWRGPWGNVQSLQASFGPMDGEYVLVGYGVGTAFVLTAREELADKHGDAPKSCYCTGPFQHPFGALPRGGRCPTCASSVKCRR
jgi:hypothetical protein